MTPSGCHPFRIALFTASCLFGEKIILLLFRKPIPEHGFNEATHLHALFIQLRPNPVPELDGQVDRSLGVVLIAMLAGLSPRLLRPRLPGLGSPLLGSAIF